MLCIRFRRIAFCTGQKAFGSRVLGIPALTAQNTFIINASGYADIIHTHSKLSWANTAQLLSVKLTIKTVMQIISKSETSWVVLSVN